MGHTILSLAQDRLTERCMLGKPMMNIGGETYDVDVVTEKGYSITSEKYKVYKKGTKELLCEFCPWHMHNGPDMYQIEGVSVNGIGDATLIVIPSLESWKQYVNDCDPEDTEE